MNWERIIDSGLTAAIGTDAIIYALAAIGLNMHFGYTGLLNFGQVAFMAVGAYGVGISVFWLGWSMWVGVAVGLGASLVLALLLGIPALRLRADYLAITTIAAGEILRFIFRAASLSDYTGGSNGLSGYRGAFADSNPLPSGSYGIGFLKFGLLDSWVFIVGWALVILCSVGVYLLIRSPWGRVIKGIREDEDAVRALGKNVYFYKLQSLAVGGLIGALAGIMFALGKGSIQPDNYGTQTTFLAYVALILGGTARIIGPVIGSMILWFILAFSDTFLRQAVDNDYIPTWLMSGTQVGQARFMLVGAGLVLLMVFRPQGILGDRRELMLEPR